METEFDPQYIQAKHLARLWKVTAMHEGMGNKAATDFAVQQATEFLQEACRIDYVKREGPALIRKDIENIDPTPSNPLKRLGPVNVD